MSALQKCRNVDEFAALLGTSYSKIAHFYYNKNIREYYTSFDIAKKSGGARVISAPVSKLKNLQSKIADLLCELYQPGKSVHGFVKQRSILTNAKLHVRKKYVFNIDLDDFFGAITFPRVYGLLKSPPYNLAETVAATIAHLCTLRGSLPQGAPTSPVLSNMICRGLDRQLRKLAFENRASYSRYADDITFSFYDPEPYVSSQVVKFSVDGGNYYASAGDVLASVVSTNGFKINSQKTRLQDRYERQMVTGLVVNKKVNVPRGFVRKTCAMMHSIELFGIAGAQNKFIIKGGDSGGFIENVVYGRLLYMKGVVGIESQVYHRLALRFNKLGIKKKVPVKSAQPVDKKFAAWATPKCWVVETDEGQGSGFMVTGQYLITCAHVVGGENRGGRVLAYRPSDNDGVREALVCYVDKKNDVAILKILGERSDYECFHYGHRSYTLTAGERINILGYPQYGAANDGLKINSAKVINDAQPRSGLVYIDKELYAGNSGGPVLDVTGAVVGVVSRGNSLDPNQAYINHSAFTNFADVQTCLDAMVAENAITEQDEKYLIQA